MSRVEADEDVPRYRGKGGRKRWTVEVYWTVPGNWHPQSIFERWAGWHTSGSYGSERDATNGYRAHTKARIGREPRWTGVRLINPQGETIEEWRANPEHGSEP